MLFILVRWGAAETQRTTPRAFNRPEPRDRGPQRQRRPTRCFERVSLDRSRLLWEAGPCGTQLEPLGDLLDVLGVDVGGVQRRRRRQVGDLAALGRAVLDLALAAVD